MPLPQPSPPPFQPRQYSSTSTLAVLSLIFGILGWCGGIGGLLAVIFGHTGKSAINRSMGRLKGTGMCTAGLVLGYLAIASWIGFGLLTWGGIKLVKEIQASRTQPFDIAKVPVPSFPELPEFTAIEDSKVRVAQVKLNGGHGPGQRMSMRIYLPEGDHALHSLACVLVAPAGTSLLTGADLDLLNADSYHEECLPYAEAGMAVVLYSLDGAPDDESTDFESMKKPFNAFNDAAAGVVNGRNALEFVLAKLPAVNPARIHAAGHSSAATLALLFAAHEPRLATCLAYAPEPDVATHFKESLKDSAKEDKDGGSLTPIHVNLVLPGFANFIERSSPLTHIARLKLPVFLFHSEDDETSPFARSKVFAEKLAPISPQMKFVTVKVGGHYDSMIEQGIPKGIEWLRQQAAP